MKHASVEKIRIHFFSIRSIDGLPLYFFLLQKSHFNGCHHQPASSAPKQKEQHCKLIFFSRNYRAFCFTIRHFRMKSCYSFIVVIIIIMCAFVRCSRSMRKKNQKTWNEHAHSFVMPWDINGKSYDYTRYKFPFNHNYFAFSFSLRERERVRIATLLLSNCFDSI